MRALKIAGLVVGVLVALLLAGVVAILLWVNPDDYRGQIEQRVERATGRPLRLAGKLDLKVFPRLALQVNDVSLGNPPGYGNEPFLTVKRASLGMRLVPLLHRRLELSRVSLDGLAVKLVSRSEDENNWKDLSKSKDHEKETGETPATQLSIAGVDLSRAILVYRDDAEKKTTRLSNLELHTGALGGDARVDLNLEFDYDEGGPRVAHVVTAAQVAAPRDSTRIEIKDLSAKGQWFGAPEKGADRPAEPAKPTDFSARAESLVVDTQAETLAPTAFNAKWGGLPLELTAAGEKLFSDRVVRGKLAIGKISPRAILASLGVKPPVTRDSKALSAFSFKSDYRLTEKSLGLNRLDLNLDDTHLRGELGIDDLARKTLSFNLSVDNINVDRYREPESKSGKQASKPPTDLPLAAIRKLNLHGRLRIGHATLADLKFDDVSTTADAAAGRFTLGPTQAHLFGGTYNGNMTLDARSPQAKLSLNEHVRDIDVGKLVEAAFKSRRMTGRGDANAQLNGTGNTDAAILASLAGKIDANLKDSAFNGIDLWFEMRRAIALAKRQAPPPAPAAPRTVFRTFAGSATLADGVLSNDDLRFDMDYLKARGRGTLALTSQAVDYHLTAEIYKLPAEGAGSELADLKALEIPVSITGTLAQPKVRPDVADLVKARLRKEADKQLNKQKDELKKKLGDKLRDILGR